MSYPALLDFEEDPAVTDSHRRVYRYLRKYECSHWEFRRVKTSTVAESIGMQRARTSDCIDWLIEHRYVVQQGRDGRARMLLIPWDRAMVRSVPISSTA